LSAAKSGSSVASFIADAGLRVAQSGLRSPMRVSRNWNQFKGMLDVAHPERGDRLQLPLMADYPADPSSPPAPKQPTLFD
jgi:hypothetical protein